MVAGVRPFSSVPGLLGGPEGPESFASFVDRLAAHQLVPAPITTLLAEAGVIPQDRHDVLPAGYGLDLTSEQRERFAYACRLESGELAAMLLRSLDGVAFDLTGLDVTHPNSVRVVGHREWAGFAGSACCPACLAQTGGWRLRWKLWTSFVCLTHGTLLMDVCPRCERRTGGYRAERSNAPRFATHVPRPGFCANSLSPGNSGLGRAARPCGEDLRQVPTSDLSGAPRLLEAQRAVNGVLEVGVARVAGEEVSSLTYLGHLRSLMALALHAAQPGDLGKLPDPIARALAQACEVRDERRVSEAGVRGTALHPYKGAPGDTRLVAAILPWAVELLASPDQEGVTDGLRPLVERSRGIRGSAVRAAARDFHLRGPLEVALDQVLAPRALFHRTMGHLAPAGTGSYRVFETRHVPHLIWEEDFERDFRPLLEGSRIGDTAARVAVSVALVRLSGRHTVPASIRLLGLEGHSQGASLNPLVMHLGRTGGKEAFQEALHGLATRLEGPGPHRHRDYRAAQEALAGFVVLDLETWERCREAAGMRPNRSEGLRRNTAAWVWATVLSSDPAFSPALSADCGKQDVLREVYRRFEREQLPRLGEVLGEVAREVGTTLG
ncbi:TniQ family protein [Deinococcus sp. MIMF12]|uniref:TniQ family protein n=1 Tax=Deinococcus rhizophilus TaxID=3049544 RepID=A0ABT7JIA3_9DEIO|nr:TniQ family protein [Deinococcus rhizophilus]MDL2344787.1 TniQ family protein [Deinococcus rhizophilus]